MELVFGNFTDDIMTLIAGALLIWLLESNQFGMKKTVHAVIRLRTVGAEVASGNFGRPRVSVLLRSNV